MFRITSHVEDELLVLKLEGCLAGACVPELETCWREAVLTGRAVRLDLTEVCHVDRAGQELLRRLRMAGARFTAKGCFMRELVSEISRTADAALPADARGAEGHRRKGPC